MDDQDLHRSHLGLSTPQSPGESAQAIVTRFERVARLSHGAGFSGGLNPAQWAALRYFHTAPEPARTATLFARHHATTKGTAVQTIAALVRKGLLMRQVSSQDRRVRPISVTEAGLALLERDPLSRFVNAIASLPSTSRASIAAALDDVLKVVTDR